ncbi:UNVERIFIED_CONTAM: heme/copper-type cytochrome/quinol oxidase subunit 1 [Jeotgalibacillus campisalis]
MGENNKLGEQSTPQPARKPAAVVVPLLGLIAVIVGLIVAWTNQSTSFGWFAYAPLSDTVFVGNGGAMVSQGTQLGLVVTVIGLLVLAFWAGFAIGRRSR